MVIAVRRDRGADAGRAAADAAATVRTLAVLLQAGARPIEAWRHLADAGDPVAVRVARRCTDGAELAGALDAEGGAWSDVAAAWEIATVVGAPLSEVLGALAESLQDAASAADDVRIALAEPAGTARLLLWLPFAGLLLGFALGFDTIGVLVANPFGTACVVVGLLLVVLARWWTSRMVRAAQPRPGTPGMRADLVAVALSGGAGMPRALRLVEQSTAELIDEPASTQAVLDLSRSAGIPAGSLLRASASHLRHEARVQGRLRAARLSSKLLLPLGACTLPAFLLLGVAPLMLSVLGSAPLPV